MNLYPYQEEGAEWLAQRRYGLLGDKPGLGKTAQAISASDRIGAERILVVCPACVRPNWRDQFAEVSVFDRPFVALTKTTDAPGRTGVTAVSYELAERGPTHEAIVSNPWDLVVIDEVHFLKARTTLSDKGDNVSKRALAILQGIGRQARRMWGLSGTLVPNGYAAELWPWLRSVGATSLSYAEFVKHFSTGHHNGYGYVITGNRNTAEFRAMIKKVCLRRTLEDVGMQLPELTITSINVDAGPVDTELYFIGGTSKVAEQEAALRAMLGTITSNTERPGADAALVLQGMEDSASSFHRYTGLAKVPPVADLVATELESGLEKIAIYAHHRDVVAELQRRLSKYGAVTYFGGMDDAKKERNKKKFIEDPKCKVFIGNIRSAGTGLDGLQAVCHNAIIVEPSWRPDFNTQAILRFHRNGQTKPVLARFVALNDSPVDRRITDVLKRKTREEAKIFN